LDHTLLPVAAVVRLAMVGLRRSGQDGRLPGSRRRKSPLAGGVHKEQAVGDHRRPTVTLGYFEWETKQYRPIPVDEQVEILSLVGDVALTPDGTPGVHAHVVVGKADGTAHGGHLLRAAVRPTLEVMLSETPTHLQRLLDPAAGIPLIRL